MDEEIESRALDKYQAKEFAEKMTKGGAIFGLKVPEPFLTLLNFGLSWGATFGSGKLAEKANTLDPGQSKQLYSLAALALPALLNVGDVAGIVSNHIRNETKLRHMFAALGQANLASHKKGVGISKRIMGVFSINGGGHDGNLMIAHAEKVMNKDTITQIGQALVNVIPTAFNIVRVNKRLNPGSAAASSSSMGLGELSDMLPGALRAALDKGVAASGDIIAHIKDSTSLGKVEQIHDIIDKMQKDGSQPTEGDKDSTAELVAEAFQRFQKEQGRNTIPKPALEPVANIIAHHIVYGDLHAFSLINIIGNEMLLKPSKSTVVAKDDVERILVKEEKIFSKGATVKVQEFMEQQSYTMEDVKRHISSQNPDEVALATILHPEAVLIAAGMTKEQIQKASEHLSDRIVENMFTIIMEGLIPLSDEELKEKGFKEDAIAFIRECEEKPHTIQMALDSTKKALMQNIARNATMGQDDKYWQDLVTAAHKPPEKPHKKSTEEGHKKEDADVEGKEDKKDAKKEDVVEGKEGKEPKDSEEQATAKPSVDSARSKVAQIEERESPSTPGVSL